jgi:hypothetical protein
MRIAYKGLLDAGSLDRPGNGFGVSSTEYAETDIKEYSNYFR